MSNNGHRMSLSLLVIAWTAGLASCASAPPSCGGLQTRNLEAAFEQARSSVGNGCAASFENYFAELLAIAEGDPKPVNKRMFSEFLVWASDEGILSRQQARDYYNRYFNVKFVSLAGDYNNCSHTCPRRDAVMLDMERELGDKERGLMKVSLDNQGYYRADELYREVELVLEATCTACAAGAGL